MQFIEFKLPDSIDCEKEARKLEALYPAVWNNFEEILAEEGFMGLDFYQFFNAVKMGIIKLQYWETQTENEQVYRGIDVAGWNPLSGEYDITPDAPDEAFLWFSRFLDYARRMN